MARLSCPTCGEMFDTESTPAMPFCSARCKKIDMGRWLEEDIRIPVDPEDDDRPEGFEVDEE